MRLLFDSSSFPASFPVPNATEIVKPILKNLSITGPEENLKKFSSFRTRCQYLPTPFMRFITLLIAS